MNYSDLKLKEPISDTPPELADWMVKLAEIKPEHSILEPCAGKGNIIKAILKFNLDPDLHYCELNKKNRESLMGYKGFLADDFDLIHGYKYDRILMNPPLKHTQKFISRTFNLLNPGGRLVCLMHKICYDDIQFGIFLIDSHYKDAHLYSVNKYFAGHFGVNALVLVIDK